MEIYTKCTSILFVGNEYELAIEVSKHLVNTDGFIDYYSYDVSTKMRRTFVLSKTRALVEFIIYYVIEQDIHFRLNADNVCLKFPMFQLSPHQLRSTQPPNDFWRYPTKRWAFSCNFSAQAFIEKTYVSCFRCV